MICFFLLVKKKAAIIKTIIKKNTIDAATIGPIESTIFVPGSELFPAGVSVGEAAIDVDVTKTVDVIFGSS
jgi:hypothetical protein